MGLVVVLHKFGMKSGLFGIWVLKVLYSHFQKKDLQGFFLSTTHILPASQNGREAQHARAMDRNLVNLFSEMTV